MRRFHSIKFQDTTSILTKQGKCLLSLIFLASQNLAMAQKAPPPSAPPEINPPKQEVPHATTLPATTASAQSNGSTSAQTGSSASQGNNGLNPVSKGDGSSSKTASGKSDKAGVKTPADNIEHGKELVSIDFPNGVNLSDIIKTISIWTGKNFVLGQGVSGGMKISIISQEPVTKEEAYQAFLSALNISGFTTVETGKIVKILPIANAKSSNIKTYYGENWAPATDEVINHVVPLHFIDVNSVVNQLRPLLGSTPFVAFTTTNSLIFTDTGNRIRRILEVIKLLDDKVSQAQVSIIPVNNTDAKDVAFKVTEIFGNRGGGTTIALQKALVDERTNSIILVGPAHTLDDIVRFIQRIDKPAVDQDSQAMIRVRPLDYADSEKLAATLQALTQNVNASKKGNDANRAPFLPQIPNVVSPTPMAQAPTPTGQSGGGATAADIAGAKVTSDKSTNSLIIQGSRAAFNELDMIITQLDRRRAQVYIEANLLDLSTGHGLDWTPAALGGVALQNGMQVPFGFNATRAATLTANTASSSTSSLAALSGIGDLGVLGILSNRSVTIAGNTLTPGALIFALKTDSNTNVLQTPSMMVSDNETANFQSASEYNSTINVPNPNAPGTVSTPLKYDVQTSLKVTPQISHADFVNMKINLQLDDAGASDLKSGYPNPIYKRSAESVLTVEDGQTAVLGGITKTSMRRTESKVPLLGDIPIIGWLFKQVSSNKEKENLTLLITPHVVRDSSDLAKIYEKTIKARDEYLRAFYGKDFKEEEFYQDYAKLEDGQVPPPKSPKNNDAKENIELQKSQQLLKEERQNVLPTEEPNPINAPAPIGGGGGSAAPVISAPAPNAPAQ